MLQEFVVTITSLPYKFTQHFGLLPSLTVYLDDGSENTETICWRVYVLRDSWRSSGDRNNPCPQHIVPNAAEPDVSADSGVFEALVDAEDVEVADGDCNTTVCTDKSEDSVEHVLKPQGYKQD